MQQLTLCRQTGRKSTCDEMPDSTVRVVHRVAETHTYSCIGVNRAQWLAYSISDTNQIPEKSLFRISVTFGSCWFGRFTITLIFPIIETTANGRKL
jgi:hypothetical protein